MRAAYGSALMLKKVWLPTAMPRTCGHPATQGALIFGRMASIYLKPMFGCIGRRSALAAGWPAMSALSSYDGARVWMLGGNQGDKVSVISFPASQFLASSS